jgi:dihydrofolate reductase
LDECLKHATEIAKSKDISEIWIIGGSQLYKSTINMIDDVHLSIINNRSLGDTRYLNELNRKNILNLSDFFENNYNLQLIEKSGNLQNLGYEFLLFSRK